MNISESLTSLALHILFFFFQAQNPVHILSFFFSVYLGLTIPSTGTRVIFAAANPPSSHLASPYTSLHISPHLTPHHTTSHTSGPLDR